MVIVDRDLFRPRPTQLVDHAEYGVAVRFEEFNLINRLQIAELPDQCSLELWSAWSQISFHGRQGDRCRPMREGRITDCSCSPGSGS